MKSDSLCYRDYLYLSNESQLKQKVLSLFLKTYNRVKKELFWEGLKSDVQRFMEECLVCQQNKVETVRISGLLQPLNIPS